MMKIFFFLGNNFLHRVEKIKPVSWRHDSVRHPFSNGVSSATASALSLHICRTEKSEP